MDIGEFIKISVEFKYMWKLYDTLLQVDKINFNDVSASVFRGITTSVLTKSN